MSEHKRTCPCCAGVGHFIGNSGGTSSTANCEVCLGAGYIYNPPRIDIHAQLREALWKSRLDYEMPNKIRDDVPPPQEEGE